MLLLALFVMSSILLGGMAVGTLVIREIRAARNADSAQVAYYAAESGNEQALFMIRKLGLSPTELAGEATLANGAKYRRVIVRDPVPLFTSIGENGVYELVLYDPAGAPPSGGVASVSLSWDADCGSASVLELSSVTFTPGVGWSPGISKFRYAHPGPVTYTLPNPLAQGARLRIRAERCDAKNVRLDAFDADGIQVAFPDRAAIVSTGEYRGTRQASQVVAPTATALSGIFDFVLFSECDIVKGGAPPVCP